MQTSIVPTRSLKASSLLWLSLVFLLCLGLRLVDLPLWQAPEDQVDGEWLATNADTYGWYAGAKEINQHSRDLPALMLRLLHRITGWRVGNIGFWLPAFLAPLSALPIGFLAARWGLPEAMALSGVLAGASLPYLERTRLGSLDTDVYTLLFPLLVVTLFIGWYESLVRREDHSQERNSPGRFLLPAFAAGLLGKAYLWCYPSGASIILCLLFSLILLLLIPKPRAALPVLAAAVLMNLTLTFGKWPSFLIALSVFGTGFLPPRHRPVKHWWAAACALLIAGLIADANLLRIFDAVSRDVFRYGHRTLAEGQLHLPPTISTVSEAIPTSPLGTMKLLADNLILFTLGVAGYVYLVGRHPSALLFVPLFLLALASTRLGFRFSMYGGAVTGLGLGCGLALIMRDLRWRTWLCRLVQGLLLGLILWIIGHSLANVQPSLVISKPHAEVLREMSEKAPRNAQFWSWWDFGYAVQYYAERATFADGERNSGEYLVPLARIYATDSPEFARNIIAYTASWQAETRTHEAREGRFPNYDNPFLRLLHNLTPEDSRALIDSLTEVFPVGDTDMAPQYLEVSWEYLKIAGVINAFGTMDLVDGRFNRGAVFSLPAEPEIDWEKGSLRFGQQELNLAGADLFRADGPRHLLWPENRSEWALVQNQITGSHYLMAENIYHSLMVQMLIADPGQFQPYFDLTLDRSPFARVYRVNLDIGERRRQSDGSGTQ